MLSKITSSENYAVNISASMHIGIINHYYIWTKLLACRHEKKAKTQVLLFHWR